MFSLSSQAASMVKWLGCGIWNPEVMGSIFFNIFICILGLRQSAVQAASNDRFQGHWSKSQAGLLAISLKSSQKTSK